MSSMLPDSCEPDVNRAGGGVDGLAFAARRRTRAGVVFAPRPKIPALGRAGRIPQQGWVSAQQTRCSWVPGRRECLTRGRGFFTLSRKSSSSGTRAVKSTWPDLVEHAPDLVDFPCTGPIGSNVAVSFLFSPSALEVIWRARPLAATTLTSACGVENLGE